MYQGRESVTCSYPTHFGFVRLMTIDGIPSFAFASSSSIL